MQIDRRLSRRAFLRTAGGGAAAFSLAAFLAACGGDGESTPGGGGPDETGAAPGFDWASQERTGQVTMVNWPLYMDRQKNDAGEIEHPTLAAFTEETGIEVSYLEQIESYEEFHAQILPIVGNGQSTGYDVMVTGFPKWFPLLIASDALIELDHSQLPNYAANVAPTYQEVSYDPGNRYGIPYQSGITGLGYNIDMTGRELTSVQELFNPEWEGRVGMFRDTLDTPNMALIAAGVNPPDATQDDWQRAADLLIQQRDAGLVRQYYGQAYIGALQNEEVAVSLAWGGDILQSQNSGYENLRFVVPDEGGLLWTDIMAIPVGAEHPVDALMLMDWFYRPEIAAQLASWIQSVSPVPAAQEILREQGDPVADNPLVFPTEEMYTLLRDYRILDEEETEAWDDLFLPIYQT
ncbi:MAG TPA: spermidine/putrescine ABC transporter substrate-binding protein [Actinomycetota bacterium]|jgi:spermidine/putrescine transport system substrate-binding protein|nr:spermidine/putrescine ABC transporter substrate-binding protein [Actinomycetota bacterium]